MAGLKKLIQEVHRRSMWQVLGIYAVASWIALQIVDVLAQNFDLPEWFPAFALGLLIIGLPVVLATAFVQEGMRSGTAPSEPDRSDERAWSENDRVASGSRLTWRNAIFGGVAAFALWGIVAAAWLTFGGGPVRASESLVEAPSIAVLPFENMSDDASNEYFSDGLSEELLNLLAKNPELRVAARTSSFAFKGQATDVREIGEALGVGAVVEGSVRKADDRVRITAQLIQVEDGFHLWSDTYDRDLSDIFGVQTEIATAISEALELELGVVAAQDPESRGLTSDLEAYDLYLLGRQRWASRSPESIREAIGFFESAIERDPAFALAHVGIADAYSVLPFYDTTVEPLDVYDRFRGAAQRALELNPGLGEVHATMGFIESTYDRDFEAAERSLTLALELAPNHPSTHHWYGNLLHMTGRGEEAVQQLEVAFSLDPLSSVIAGTLASRLRNEGRPEEARAMYERYSEMSPLIWFHHTGHAGLIAPEDPDRALELLEEWADAIGYSERRDLASLLQVFIEGPGAGDSERQAASDVLSRIAAETDLDRTDLLLNYGLAPFSDYLEILEEAVQRRHYWVGFSIATQRDRAESLDDPELLARFETLADPSAVPDL